MILIAFVSLSWAYETQALDIAPSTQVENWAKSHGEKSLTKWENAYSAWPYDAITARYQYPSSQSIQGSLIATTRQTSWSKNSFQAFTAELENAPREELQTWFYSSHLNVLTRSQPVIGNQVHVLGVDDISRYRLGLIQSARQSIWISTFLLNCDAGTEPLIQLLEQKSRSGVSVRVLLDSIFSQTDPGCLERLTRSRISVVRYSPGTLKIHHQKLGIIDGKSAWVSGDNLIGAQVSARSNNDGLRDSHLSIQGPAVRELAKVFTRRWKTATGETLPLPAPITKAGTTPCRVIEKDASKQDRRILHFIFELISRAKKHLFYNNIHVDFDHPEKSSVGREILRLIIRIANARPDLRVDMQTNHSRRPTDDHSMPRKPRNAFETTVIWAAEHLTPSPLSEIEPARQAIRALMERDNFHWWAYDGYQHSKSYSVDGVVTVIGSYNANDESQDQSTELMVACYSEALAQEHRKLYVLDWLNSIPIPLTRDR